MNAQRQTTGNMTVFFTGLMVGSLIGAGTMLLLAPQTGKKTRAKIQETGVVLRDKTTDAMEDAVAQTRRNIRQLKSGLRKQREELEQRGQVLLDEQKARLSSIVETVRSVNPA